MTNSIVHPVNVFSVEIMSTAQSLSQRLFPLGRGNKMNVIGHKAVALYTQTKPNRLLFEEAKIYPPVVINEKDILLVITPLGNMVWNGRDNYPCGSWHKYMIKANLCFSTKIRQK
jgi:hypothetical protein